MDDFYKILGVNKDASQDQIKIRYLFLVKVYHPDRYVDSNDKKMAEEELKKINQAYDIIGNVEKRRIYDQASNYQPSNNKNTQSESQTDANEVNEIVEYIGEVVQRWNSVVLSIDNSSITSVYQEKLRSLTRKVVTFSESIPFAKEKGILDNFYSQIIMSRNIGISIGFETIKRKNVIKYSQEKIIEVASYFLIIAFARFFETLSENDKQDKEVQVLLEKIPQLSLSLLKEMVSWGSSHYKIYSEDFTKTSSNSKPNPSDVQFGFCQKCGDYSLVSRAKYRKNKGMVFFRRYSEISGDFCSNCQENIFWNAFWTNLALGWWGTISFVINPFLILMNIGNYVMSWKTRTGNNPKNKTPVDWKLIGLIGVFLTIIFIYYNNQSISGTYSTSQNRNSPTHIYPPSSTKKPIATLTQGPVYFPVKIPTIIPTNSSDKVFVTVINNGKIPQDVYVDGIYIFTIQPDETKTFRFSKGTWQVHLCYPGNFPCDNKYLEDMNHDSFTFTIN